MRHIPSTALALLVTACVNPPDYVWMPTDPAFGQDQAIVQSAFCSKVLDEAASRVEDPADSRILTRMSEYTKARVAYLDATDVVNVQLGEQQAKMYTDTNVAPVKFVSAVNLCTDVANISSRGH